MALFDRFLSWLERSATTWRAARAFTRAQRAKSIGERIFGHMMFGGAGYGWPGGWSQDRIEQVQHFKHWTFIAIDAIAKKVAGLTPNAAWVGKDGSDALAGHRHLGPAVRKRYLEHRAAKTLQAIKPHESIDPLPDNHPGVRLLHNPNGPDVAYDLWYELEMYEGLTGNSYLWVVPNRLGLPCELWVIPAHWVFPRVGKRELVEWYEVRPWAGPGVLRFPPEEIIHFRTKNPIHKIDGWSKQAAIAEWIDSAESVDRSRFFQFKNGCFPVGAVELGENYNDPSDQDLERLYAKFFARIQGESNAGKPIIMPPGAKYNALMIAPAEMAYTQSADQLRDWILAAYGVPKEIAGIQDAGSEIAMYGPLFQFCTQTIIPKLQYRGQVLTEKLGKRWPAPAGKTLRYWWDDPTPPNPQQVNQDIETDAKWGATTPNEIRALRGREPYAFGGDDPLLPIGTAPLPLATGEDLSGIDFSLLPSDGNRLPPPPPRHRQPRRKAQTADGTPILDVPDIQQQTNFSCGAASLMAVCRYFGVGPETEADFIALLDTDTDDGTEPEMIVSVARSLGLDAVEVEGMDALAASVGAGRPVVCLVQSTDDPDQSEAGMAGHYVVAIGVGAKSIYVQDPTGGRKRIGRKLWLQRWHDEAGADKPYYQYGIAIGQEAKRLLALPSPSANGHATARW